MQRLSLDKRMSVIVSYVRGGKTVCDVGTDHALIPCWLSQRGEKNLIACDINEKPLNAAKANLELYGAENVKLILSDGLDKIDFADDVIVAGMGGELIAEIVSKCRFLSDETRFILQPMTKHEELRRGLYLNGFEIIEETAVKSGGKLFIVIYSRYTGNKSRLDDKTAFIGTSGDKDYIKMQLEKLRKMGNGNAAYAKLADEISEML